MTVCVQDCVKPVHTGVFIWAVDRLSTLSVTHSDCQLLSHIKTSTAFLCNQRQSPINDLIYIFLTNHKFSHVIVLSNILKYLTLKIYTKSVLLLFTVTGEKQIVCSCAGIFVRHVVENEGCCYVVKFLRHF